MDDSSALADGSHPSPPVPSSAQPDEARPRRGLSLVLGLMAVLVVALDQGTKYLAVRDLVENVPVTVIPGWLQLRLYRNSGAAFSLATGSTWIFTVIAIVVSVAIVRVARRLGSAGWALALGLLLGGAVGNLVDRLLRWPGVGRGHVVDFIEYLRFPFMNFPIFNVADSAITTSAVLIAILGLRGVGVDGRRVQG